MTHFEEAGFTEDTVFIATVDNFFATGTLFVLDNDDGSEMPQFRAVNRPSKTYFEFVNKLTVSTPFTSRGWSGKTEFVEVIPTWFPEGAVIVLDEDDGSEEPLFKTKDESVCGESYYVYLESLRLASEYSQTDEITPFENEGFTEDDLFEVVEPSPAIPLGSLVKLKHDDGSTNPRFVNVNTGQQNYITLSRLVKVECKTYERLIKSSQNDAKVVVDVYSVLDAFEVNNSAVAHAIKKLLAPGKRGVKSEEQDIREAISSLERSLTM